MITPDLHESVLKRDGYTCQLRGPHCEGRGYQVAHILFGDRKGKHTAKDIRDWVDQEWNLAAACHSCNVGTRSDKGPEAREAHIRRMLKLDKAGFLNWDFRRPPELRDEQIHRMIGLALEGEPHDLE